MNNLNLLNIKQAVFKEFFLQHTDSQIAKPEQVIFKGFQLQVNINNLSEEKKYTDVVKNWLIVCIENLKNPPKNFDWEIEDLSADLKNTSLTESLVWLFARLDPNTLFLPSQAWDATYVLRGNRGINFPNIFYVEPVFEASASHFVLNEVWNEVPNQTPIQQFQTHLTDQIDKSVLKSEPILELLNIPKAWDKFFLSKSKKPGEGVIIAHPDTGYLPHKDIWPNLRLDLGRDFVDGDDKPIDDLDNSENQENNPGHGTATASVIISDKGPDSENDQVSSVTGVAYGADLIPIRISPTVLLREMLEPDLSRAIEYSTDQGAHIISISMGGLPTWGLRKAIINAQKRGIIVLASAGNGFNFVVWPAAHDSVIAVASSNKNDEIADHSCKGSRVDVAAPGDNVTYAKVTKGANGPTYEISSGSGTSFAVALVAGVAALWLSHWGREKLEDKYGLERIPFVFDKLLRETCRVPDDWDTEIGGAGIVDVYALLSTELPEPDEPSIQVPLAFKQADSLISQGFETLANLYDELIANPEFSEELEKLFSRIFDRQGKDLRQYMQVFGQELTFLFGTNHNLFKQLQEALASESSNTDIEVPLRNALEELRNSASDYLINYLPDKLPNTV
jgi:serine protease